MNFASEIDPSGLQNENQRLREALESLHSADARYRAMWTRSPSPFWILQDGLIAFVNPAMIRMLGASSEDQVKNHAPCEFIHPDFHAVVLSRIQSALDTGIPVPDLEELFVRLDGALIDVHVTAMPIPYEGRNAVQASFVETSERRRFEQALRKSERNLRLIAENTTEVILAYNMDRKPLYVNPAFERHTGYSLEEIYARHFIVWIHPDDQERMLAFWEDLFRGKAFYEEEYRLITKQGQMKWSSATWSPLYDESGRQVGVQGRERDISEKKKAEEARRQTEARYRLAFANASVGVAVHNAEGRFLEANPAYCRIMGYSEAELRLWTFVRPLIRTTWPLPKRSFSNCSPGT
jgi:PAS domain S-box-containing protein